MELTQCVVVVESQFHQKIRNLKNMKKVFLALNCHDNLTDTQKERFRMRQKQINLAKKSGSKHIFQKEFK